MGFRVSWENICIVSPQALCNFVLSILILVVLFMVYVKAQNNLLKCKSGTYPGLGGYYCESGRLQEANGTKY